MHSLVLNKKKLLGPSCRSLTDTLLFKEAKNLKKTEKFMYSIYVFLFLDECVDGIKLSFGLRLVTSQSAFYVIEKITKYNHMEEKILSLSHL
jgi:hypothetical protein